jgi:hypothetical protein
MALISLKGQVNATCLAFEAGKNTAGNKGGKIVILANQTITLDNATLKAVGDFNPSRGLGTGGNINGSLIQR